MTAATTTNAAVATSPAPVTKPATAATGTSTTDAGASSRFVGRTYRSAPPRGVTSLGGALIGGRYSVARMKAAGREMLWLERRTSRAGARIPTVRVLAVLDLPRRRAGEDVAIGGCTRGGRPRPAVVAIWPTDRGSDAPARLAWLADGAGGRFREIDPARVSCPELLAG